MGILFLPPKSAYVGRPMLRLATSTHSLAGSKLAPTMLSSAWRTDCASATLASRTHRRRHPGCTLLHRFRRLRRRRTLPNPLCRRCPHLVYLHYRHQWHPPNFRHRHCLPPPRRMTLLCRRLPSLHRLPLLYHRHLSLPRLPLPCPCCRLHPHLHLRLRLCPCTLRFRRWTRVRVLLA